MEVFLAGLLITKEMVLWTYMSTASTRHVIWITAQEHIRQE